MMMMMMLKLLGLLQCSKEEEGMVGKWFGLLTCLFALRVTKVIKRIRVHTSTSF